MMVSRPTTPMMGWVQGWNEEEQRYRVHMDIELEDQVVKVISVKEHCMHEDVWINGTPHSCNLQRRYLGQPKPAGSILDSQHRNGKLARCPEMVPEAAALRD